MVMGSRVLVLSHLVGMLSGRMIVLSDIMDDLL
jgi:hypothetical protein